MKIKPLLIITVLFLCLIFKFEKTSYGLTKVSQDDISELKILKYFPQNNKTLLISNTKSSKISDYIRKNFELKEKDRLVLVKNSILAYLGIDLDTNKLEDIYNNEIIIATYDNKEKDIDDVLIIFKIKESKDIDDILNLKNKIDEPEKLIKISRENKLNYLKYIYRTKDNYILTSSKQALILDTLQSTNFSKKISPGYESIHQLLNNFKNEHNIFLTKDLKFNKLLNDENYYPSRNDYLVTFFDFKDKEILLNSHLVNNNKNINSLSYEKIKKEKVIDKNKYQIEIYDNLNYYNKYLKKIKINNFERSIFEELNDKLRQNLLFLYTGKNWVIIFENTSLSTEKIKLLEDFNRYILTNNDNIYTIYSKNTLQKEDNMIKESNYKKIFSIQSENLTFISNNLINDMDIDSISKEFIYSKGDNQTKYFLNKKISLNNPYFIEIKNNSYLENFNYFFKDVINLSITEFKEIIKQSIPETTPIYYAKTNLKLF